jgi:hypothetical protein
MRFGAGFTVASSEIPHTRGKIQEIAVLLLDGFGVPPLLPTSELRQRVRRSNQSRLLLVEPRIAHLGVVLLARESQVAELGEPLVGFHTVRPVQPPSFFILVLSGEDVLNVELVKLGGSDGAFLGGNQLVLVQATEHSLRNEHILRRASKRERTQGSRYFSPFFHWGIQSIQAGTRSAPRFRRATSEPSRSVVSDNIQDNHTPLRSLPCQRLREHHPQRDSLGAAHHGVPAVRRKNSTLHFLAVALAATTSSTRPPLRKARSKRAAVSSDSKKSLPFLNGAGIDC